LILRNFVYALSLLRILGQRSNVWSNVAFSEAAELWRELASNLHPCQPVICSTFPFS